MGLGNIRNPRIVEELISIWKYADQEIQKFWPGDKPADLYNAEFISSRVVDLFFGEIFRNESKSAQKGTIKALKQDFYDRFPHMNPRALRNHGSSGDDQEVDAGYDGDPIGEALDDYPVYGEDSGDEFPDPVYEGDDPHGFNELDGGRSKALSDDFDQNAIYRKAVAGQAGISSAEDAEDPAAKAQEVLKWVEGIPAQVEPVATWINYLRFVAENVAERNPNYEVSEMDRVKATIQKEAVGLDDHSYQAAMPA
jgi:hypothetical protein